MRKTFVPVERLEEVARNALLGGYGQLLTTSEFDKAAPGKVRRVVVLTNKHNCERPYVYELHGRYSATHGKKVLPLMIRGTARCRKCEACMNYRAWQWRERGQAEFRSHLVTLFGTFTMSPEQHYLLDARIASGACGRHSRDLRDLSAQELFAARVQAFGDELTKYVKVIREGRGGQRPHLRYLLVAETHDSDKTSEVMRGRPHYHVMLHTDTLEKLVNGQVGDPFSEWLVAKDGRILVRDNAWLRKQWTFGYTSFELARDSRAVWYVCKYISKAMAARVRASQEYGIRGVDTEKPGRVVPGVQEIDPHKEQAREQRAILDGTDG